MPITTRPRLVGPHHFSGHTKHGPEKKISSSAWPANPLLLFYTSLLPPPGSQTPICYPNQYPHQRCARIKGPQRPSFPFPDPNPSPSPQPCASRSPFVTPSSSSSSSSATNTFSNNLTALFSTSISSSSLADLRLSLCGGDPLLYSFAEIIDATNSFLYPPLSSSVGWRCSLRCIDAAVVHCPFRGDPAALPAHFTALCQSHHIVVAHLLGASLSGDDLYLVYEYVLGATLADCLKNPRNPSFSPLSSWFSRIQVTADLAQGLEYIHHYSAGTVHTPQPDQKL